MHNAAELIRAAWNCTNTRELRYQQQEMLSEMLAIIGESTSITTDHQFVIRKIALELTDLVDPNAIESEAR
jgi:hypothetical protein